MKDITKFITEAISNDAPKFSAEELRKDIDNLDSLSGQEKKDMAAKYGLTTRKTADIMHAILLQLKAIRKTKKSFDKEDLYEFSKLHDYTTSRICAGLADEPKEFQIFVRDSYFESLKKKKLDSYALVTSLNDYRLSYADKDAIKRYQKVAKAVDELNPTKEKLDKEEHFEMINNKITELMQDFKVIYMKKIEEHAKIQYAYYSNDNNLKVLEKAVKDAEQAIEDYKKEKGIRFISYNDHIGYKYEQAYDKARSKVSKFKAFTRMYATEKAYLDRCAKDGEEIFARNIASISERLIKNNLNVNNLSISDVKNDPKFFEMMLSDGTKKLYLRSVFAAQYSEKMIPHFRFIITERK